MHPTLIGACETAMLGCLSHGCADRRGRADMCNSNARADAKLAEFSDAHTSDGFQRRRRIDPRKRSLLTRSAANELFVLPYSITSSIRARKVRGTSRPSAFSALRLMISSNLVGRTTGKSAGFSPLRTLPV